MRSAKVARRALKVRTMLKCLRNSAFHSSRNCSSPVLQLRMAMRGRAGQAQNLHLGLVHLPQRARGVEHVDDPGAVQAPGLQQLAFVGHARIVPEFGQKADSSSLSGPLNLRIQPRVCTGF
jgi:hypothetical protein